MGWRTRTENARQGRKSIDGIGERTSVEWQKAGRKTVEASSLRTDMGANRDKCSSLTRMSGEEGDKGMHIAAKSSLSGAGKA